MCASEISSGGRERIREREREKERGEEGTGLI